MQISFFIIVAAVAAVGCSNRTENPDKKARIISDAFVAKEYSMDNMSLVTVNTIRSDENWTFTYDIDNENWTGGPLFVIVGKDGKIVDHGGQQ